MQKVKGKHLPRGEIRQFWRTNARVQTFCINIQTAFPNSEITFSNATKYAPSKRFGNATPFTSSLTFGCFSSIKDGSLAGPLSTSGLTPRRKKQIPGGS